jgi:hypothetical protein
MLALHTGLSKRPRWQTETEWVAEAQASARLLARRANEALAFPETADLGTPVALVAVTHRVTNVDVSAAARAAASASSCAVGLAAAAARFAPDSAAVLHAEAARLGAAAAAALARAQAFAPSALSVARSSGTSVKLHVTDAEREMLADPPVLVPMAAAGTGAGAAYLGLSDADQEKLRVMYLEWKWTQAQIAEVLHCSDRKVRSLIADLDVQRVPDEDGIREAIIEGLNSGESVGVVRLCGALEARGVQYTGRAVLRLLRELDPVGIATRKRRAVARVVYNEFNVNGLWHMDGNELLVRWGITIHGVICGASRMVVSAGAADNKFAPTVHALMFNAMATYGIPRKLRADYGTENVDVQRFCEVLNAAGYRIAYIEGAST